MHYKLWVTAFNKISSRSLVQYPSKNKKDANNTLHLMDMFFQAANIYRCG